MLMGPSVILAFISGSQMPVMIRAKDNGKGKANKIVWKIIGKPAVLNFKRSPQQEKMNKELLYQETSRVR